MANAVNIIIDVETKKAIQDIFSFSKAVEKEFSGLDKTISSLGSSFKSVGLLALGAFAGFSIKGFVDSALEADAAISKLSKSLKVTGSFSKAAVDEFTELATQIQLVTGYSDEYILNQVSYAKALGASNAQAKSIIQTATLLSKALGTDLGSATETLIKTFSGDVPRSLSKIIPELNGLSTNSLRTGGALDLLNNKLAAFDSTGKSFSSLSLGTQISVLKQNIGDLAEEIGGKLINNPIFKIGLNLLNSSILNLINIIKSINFDQIAAGIQKLVIGVTVFLAVSNGVAAIKLSFFLLSSAVTFFSTNLALASARGTSAFTALGVSINATKIAINLLKAAATLGLTLLIDQVVSAVLKTNTLSDAFSFLGNNIKKLFLEIGSLIGLNVNKQLTETNAKLKNLDSTNIEKIKKELDNASESSIKLGKDFGKTKRELESEVKSLAEAIKKAGFTPIQAIKNEQEERLKIVTEAFKKRAILEEQFADLSSKIQIDAAKKTAQEVAKMQSIRQGIVSESSKNAFGSAALQEQTQKARDGGASESQIKGDILTGQISAAVSSLSKGAQGAADILSVGVGAAVDSFAPGMGQVAGEMFKLFAQGPEAVKATIKSFMEGIPIIIRNVISSIPVAITAIIESLPALVQALITELVVKFPQVVTAFINDIPRIIDSFIAGFIENLPKIIEGLVSGLSNGIGTAMIGLVSSLISKAPQIAFEVIVAFIKEIPKVAKGFLDSLLSGLEEGLRVVLNTISGGLLGKKKGEGGKGAVSDGLGIATLGLSKIFGFAEGGRIPNIPKFENDGAIIRANANEQILGGDLSDRLDSFLKNGSSNSQSQNLTVNIQVGEESLASVLLNLNQRGFRTA